MKLQGHQEEEGGKWGNLPCAFTLEGGGPQHMLYSLYGS